MSGSSWYDGIVDGLSSIGEAAEDGWDYVVDAYTDQSTERIKSAAEQIVSDESANTPNGSRKSMKVTDTGATTQGFNWQKAGVIVGALGLVVAVVRLT